MKTIYPLERESLRKIIQDLAVVEGQSTLTSGLTSNYLIDMKKVLMDPYGCLLIQRLLEDPIKSLDINSIGGVAQGGIPLVSLMVQQTQIRGWWLRKSHKEHGSKALFDGNFYLNDKVVLLEDVTTTGNSIKKAIDTVISHSGKVESVITLVDRQQGARELIENMNISFDSIFIDSEFSK